MGRIDYRLFYLLILFVVMICSFGINSVSAADTSAVYVSTHGNDNYDGLSALYNSTSGSGPKATIKNATKTVLSNGTIYISNGIYNENGISINKNMKFIGENQQNTIISGFTSGSIFSINGANVSLLNLTITNGNGTIGAIFIIGNLTVDNCTFTNNNATYGGAICSQGNVTINNSILTNNKGTSGGAIYNHLGTITITNSTFTDNKGTGGGVIYNEQGTTTITNSTFTDNKGTGGGVIYNEQGAITVSNSILTNNNGTGGGVICNQGTTTIINSTFTNNRGTTGGVIYSRDGVITVSNSTIENNSGTGGGVVYNEQNASLIMNFNRIINNKGVEGKVIYNSGGTVDANNNWWGSNNDPSANLVGATVTSWLVLTINTTPNSISNKKNSTVTVDLTHDQNGNYHDPNLGCIPDGVQVNLTSTKGDLNTSSTSLITGETSVIFTANTEGTGNIAATADNQNVSTQILIYPPLAVNTTDPKTSAITNNSLKPVTINFNLPIFVGSSYDKIKITGPSGDIPITVTINGSSLILTPTSNYADGTYTVNIPVNAVMDLLSNGLETIFSTNFTVDTVTPTANATPKGGLYNTIQTVKLSMYKTGTIYYTTNGQDPTTSSQEYTTPITINTNTTLKYFAIDLAGNLSPVYTENYVIDTIAPIAEAIPKGGLYNSVKTVTIVTSKPGIVYYTTDGEDPTTASQEYTTPITINTNTTLKYFAIDLAGNLSPIYTENYVFDTTKPTVVTTPNEGVYNTTQTVTLLTNRPGTIYYTIDGTTPTKSSNKYSSPVVVSKSETLKFIAVDTFGNTSQVYTEIYVIDRTSPTATAVPTGGVYNTSKTVALYMNESGTIYYTLNGTKPTNKSNVYTRPLLISKTTVLKYFVVDLAGNKSPIYTEMYTIDKAAPKPVNTTPKVNSKNVSLTAPITIKFSENILKGVSFSKIYIKNLSTGKIAKSTITSIKGNTLTIKMTMSRLSRNNYQIYIPASAVKDYAGNNLLATYTFKFKTGS